MAVGNAENLNVTGVLTFDGSNTFTGSAVTQFAPVVGGASNAVATIAVGSANQVMQSSGAGVNPAWSTATYPATTTANQLLFSSATNTVGGLSTANSGVLVTNSTGVPSISGPLTNGQIIVGNTGATPTAATITGGTGISVINGGGTITINSTGGLTWTAISANQTLAINNGYICVSPGGALSLALPTTAAVGSEIEVTLDGATSWTITQGAGQQIRIGNVQTTSGAGGSLASTAAGNSVRFICSVANNKFNVISSIGNITVV